MEKRARVVESEDKEYRISSIPKPENEKVGLKLQLCTLT